MPAVSVNIRLQRNARTSPAVRSEIQASTLATASLARQCGVSEETVAKWRKREDVQDASHCPHRLQTTLTPAQEAVVVELRKLTLLPLDDLLSLVQEFINADASRSGLDRCLRRQGVSRLADLRPKEETPKRPVKGFKDYTPGFVHVDVKYLPQMADEDRRTYLIKPAHPQTNGMVERFNGRISDVLKATHFRSGEHLEGTLQRYAALYNHHIPQHNLGHISPFQALKQWHQKQPDLFLTDPGNLPGPDTPPALCSSSALPNPEFFQCVSLCTGCRRDDAA